MEVLFEHTLQRQNKELQTEVAEMKTQMAAQNAQLTELTSLLKGQLVTGSAAPRPPDPQVEYAVQVNASSVTNITQQTVTQNIVAIMPWDGECRIGVGIEAVKAAFAENARLREYARLGDHELTDPEIAPPYVTELLMDLTKRAHADPAARNVYLNPRRADQALVHMTSGQWEVLPLQEATRLMFDGVAQGMQRVSRLLVSGEERRQLPLEAQSALSMAGLMYDDEPEEYARRAKGPMAAHLQNTHPPLGSVSARAK